MMGVQLLTSHRPKKRLSEKKIWSYLNQFQKENKEAHFTRIESSTINGIPDVYCVFQGYSFWLELKANVVKNCNMSKFQMVWHINNKRAGGNCFILNWPLLELGPKLLEVREPSAVIPVSTVPVPVLHILLWLEDVIL